MATPGIKLATAAEERIDRPDRPGMDRKIEGSRWAFSRWPLPAKVGAVALGVIVAVLAAVRFIAGSGESTLRMPKQQLTIATVEQGTFHDLIPLRARVEPRETVYIDAIDGAVARAMKRSDRFGALLDSALDRYADAAIFAGLGYYFADRVQLELLVLAFAGQLLFTTNLPASEALRLSLRDWFPWALLAPVVVWLASKFPLVRGKLGLSVPVHLVACMVALLICELFAPTPPQVTGPGPRAGQPRFRGPEDGPPFGPGPGRPERPPPRVTRRAQV